MLEIERKSGINSGAISKMAKLTARGRSPEFGVGRFVAALSGWWG
jgi:hypothetical protein